jgi:hypothetical protein
VARQTPRRQKRTASGSGPRLNVAASLQPYIVHRHRHTELACETHDELSISQAVGTQVMINVVDVE